ncbi:MAG: asparaginase domain-containing protein [Nanoarchaeota archaeon]|nr:asparaginase domain-containing protein [Nanoarchaeota archaeon]
MKIKLITCGGTIDCENIDENNVYSFKESYIPKMLKQSRCNADIEIKFLMAKDSLLMDEKDRQRVLEECKKSKEDRIIITHGTDTMVETAKTLGNEIKDKTIVLLGAMVPYNQKNSDALFNLGSGISAVQTLSKGVYIAMNGKIFDWDNVMKNKKLERFETIKDKN